MLLNNRAKREWIVLKLLTVDIRLVHTISFDLVTVLFGDMGIQEKIKVLTVRDGVDVVDTYEIASEYRDLLATVERRFSY